MPKKYKKNYKLKKQIRRYARSQPQGSSWGQLVQAAGTAYAAYQGVQQLRQIVNSELLHYDENGTSTPTGSTGDIIGILRGMTQGDTNNTMHGNSILLKSVQTNFTVNMNASATSTRLRVLMLLDTRPLAALPAITDILSSNTINAFMNIDDQIKRFRILKSFTVVVNTQYPEKVYKLYKKMNLHCKFNDSQVPILNDILYVLLSDESTNTPTVTYNSRLRFYDN